MSFIQSFCLRDSGLKDISSQENTPQNELASAKNYPRDITAQNVGQNTFSTTGKQTQALLRMAFKWIRPLKNLPENLPEKLTSPQKVSSGDLHLKKTHKRYLSLGLLRRFLTLEKHTQRYFSKTNCCRSFSPLRDIQ